MPEMKPESKILHEEFIEHLIKKSAEEYSKIRRLKRRQEITDLINKFLAKEEYSTEEETKIDWHNAVINFVYNILFGEDIKFINIEPKSYYRLEEIWLTEVKELKAYIIWEQMDTGSAEGNYYKACAEIRNKLTDKNIKASKAEFKLVEDYLIDNYLNKEGKIDKTKEGTLDLIERKAKRILATTSRTNMDEDRYLTETYVKMFYENIIPAVKETDKAKSPATCHIAQVLKAFQFSKHPGNRFFIINCFEAAIAIYFLDPNLINELWTNAEACNLNMAYVEDWPKDLACYKITEQSLENMELEGFPKEVIKKLGNIKDQVIVEEEKFMDILKETIGEEKIARYKSSILKNAGKFNYDDRDKMIIYNGKMDEDEKISLLNSLTGEKHKNAVESLYMQSNADPKLMTL